MEPKQPYRECPVCGQSGLHKVMLLNVDNKIAELCEECDSFWINGNSENLDDYEQFGVFMERLGLPPTWDYVVILD